MRKLYGFIFSSVFGVTTITDLGGELTSNGAPGFESQEIL